MGASDLGDMFDEVGLSTTSPRPGEDKRQAARLTTAEWVLTLDTTLDAIQDKAAECRELLDKLGLLETRT